MGARFRPFAPRASFAGALEDGSGRPLGIVPVLAAVLLLAAAPALAATAESEPNDTPATANALGAGLLSAAYPPAGAGAAIEGSLAPGDVDWFSFELAAGQLVAIAVVTPDGGAFSDPALRLVAPNGTVLADDDDSGPGFLPALRRRVTTSGVYRVGVTGFGDSKLDGSGHSESTAYRLAVAVVASPPLFPEPLPDTNGNAASADPLPPIGTTFGAGAPGGVAVLTGAIAPGDVDFFRVPVRPGDSFAAFVWDEGAGSFADPVLRLLSGSGPSVRDDDDAGPGLLPAILATTPAASASATLAVSGFRDTAFSGAAHEETFTYHLVVAQPPFVDSDGDGVADGVDNCPYQANPSQSDVGGIGYASAPDGIGDACQCGDVTGDGKVTPSDTVMLQRALLVPPVATLARPDLCDVGGSAGCTLSDVSILQRAQLLPATASIQPVCAASRPH